MGMTVNQLRKRLDKLIADGCGRRKVVINRRTFSEIEEWTHLDVEGIGPETILMLDGDGFIAENKDGTERQLKVVTLAGSLGADLKGNLVDRC